MSDLTSYELADGIAWVTMDDGKVNALSAQMLGELHSAFDRAEADEAVVVLTGREGRLSAGFDLATFSAGAEPVVEMLRLGATLCARIVAFPRPVVVACSGHAVAAGAFLLLSADARIGIEGSYKLGLNEVQIGLTMPMFVIELAQRRLTPKHFDRSVVTAEIFDPSQAVEAGFLDQTVAATDLRERAQAEAVRLRDLNAGAHRATKLRARRELIEALDAAIEAELTVEALSAQA